MSVKDNLEKLIAARDISAQIVARDGDEFLPIFERLDQEVEAMEARKEALEKALIIAANKGDD